jgi:GNAT superfamily N-acetyltransferase
MEENYSIERAQPEHLQALPEIERHAAALFEGWDVPRSVLEDTTPLADFATAQAAGLLWVAVSSQHRPVGFALVERAGTVLHLEELDVHPRHGQRGVGTALVRAVCTWAREQGYREITLTTYRDIPWNGPFYERLGFVTLRAGELSRELQERVKTEAERGLDPERRVAMRKALGKGICDGATAL